MYHIVTNKNQAGVAIFILGKAVLKTRKILRNKGEYYIIEKRLSLRERITILNLYALEQMKQNLIELKGKLHKSTITVTDFKPLCWYLIVQAGNTSIGDY